MKKDRAYQQQQTDYLTPIPVESLADPPPLLWSPALEREQRSKGATQGTAVALSLSRLAEQKSAGPALEITDGHGGLTPFACLHLSAVMVYPRDRDVDARNEFLATMKAEIGAELQRKTHDAVCRALLAIQTGKWIDQHGGVATLARAPGPFAINDRVVDSKWPGSLAGCVLLKVVQLAQVRPPASINRAVVIIERALKNAGTTREGNGAKSGRRIRQAWERYRPATPLWAAFLAWHAAPRRERPGYAPDFFAPFQLENLPTFLAIAEVYRRLGIKLYAHGRTEPILDPAETWQPPPDLQLPNVRVTIPSLEDWEAKTVEEYQVER